MWVKVYISWIKPTALAFLYHLSNSICGYGWEFNQHIISLQIYLAKSQFAKHKWSHDCHSASCKELWDACLFKGFKWSYLNPLAHSEISPWDSQMLPSEWKSPLFCLSSFREGWISPRAKIQRVKPALDQLSTQYPTNKTWISKTFNPAVLEFGFQLGQSGVRAKARWTPEGISEVVKTPGIKQKYLFYFHISISDVL